jgi:succinate dehydrogenase / fumarate reductase iron-sulfur subunit
MQITLKIERFDPQKDEKPYYTEFVIDALPDDRLVELLVRIKRTMDSTLAFRKSCVHGVCGSDAMRINGKERLACKVLVKDVARKDGDIVVFQPLNNLPVEKDLMVNQEEFFYRYRLAQPFLITEKKNPKKEWLQTPEQRQKIDEGTKCILCESCYSACPVLIRTNAKFLGPAQIVQAFRFNEDSRDNGFTNRLEVLDLGNGVWACQNHFKCTQVCPRDIKITRLINMTKNRIKKYHKENE